MRLTRLNLFFLVMLYEYFVGPSPRPAINYLAGSAAPAPVLCSPEKCEPFITFTTHFLLQNTPLSGPVTAAAAAAAVSLSSRFDR